MRARSIKPGVCDNELLGTADPFCTLLFERLWMMADREGRLEDRPLRIKAKAFPYREGLDIEALLNWLHDKGFIQRYTAGDRYIQICKFSEHQKPHQNEKASIIPAPSEQPKKEESTTKEPSQHNQGTKHLALTPSSLTPDSGLLTADRLMVPSEPVAQKRDGSAAERVFEHWKREHKHPKAVLDGKRKRAIEQMLKLYDEATLCQSISGYLNSPHHMGQNDQRATYDDIELFMRNATKVENGLKFARGPPAPALSAVAQARQKLRESVNGNGRVVSEQSGSGEGGLGQAVGLLRG